MAAVCRPYCWLVALAVQHDRRDAGGGRAGQGGPHARHVVVRQRPSRVYPRAGPHRRAGASFTGTSLTGTPIRLVPGYRGQGWGSRAELFWGLRGCAPCNARNSGKSSAVAGGAVQVPGRKGPVSFPRLGTTTVLGDHARATRSLHPRKSASASSRRGDGRATSIVQGLSAGWRRSVF